MSARTFRLARLSAAALAAPDLIHGAARPGCAAVARRAREAAPHLLD